MSRLTPARRFLQRQLKKITPTHKKSRWKTSSLLSATDKEPTALEIMELQEFQRSKEFTARDAGMDLINEDVGTLSMKGTLKEFVNKTLDEKSGWEIGTDEIGTSKNITLEYESNETKTKRLVQMTGRFGAEVSYSFAFQGS